MRNDAADPPLRQLTRLRAEFSLAAAQFSAGLMPYQPRLAIEFGIVARICLPDWVQGGSIVAPVVPTRAITVRKLALSLGRPPETVRRHVHQLRDHGVVTLSDGGVALATTPENEMLVRQCHLNLHDLMLSLIETMCVTCDLNLPIGAEPAFGLQDVIERALDAVYLPIDTFRPRPYNMEAFYLWGALTAVAVRNVTYDPVLSRLYAREIPPDHVRIGIALRPLAAAVSMPYSTAWRHIRSLHADGLVTRLADDMWTILTANLLNIRVANIGTPPSALLLGKIRELALLGLDPARAADYFQAGRPRIADLDLSQDG